MTEQAELFKEEHTEIMNWEGVFNGKSGIWLCICKGQCVLVDEPDAQWITQKIWWRERKPECGTCYFRTDEEWKGIPRPHLHRMIVGVTDPNVSITFRNGCCFDLRRANLEANT